MKNINAFFGVLKTFYSLDFYKKLLKVDFKYSFKVLLLFCLAVAIIGGFYFYAFAKPKMEKYTGNFSGRISQVYPKNLTITIKNGEASMDKPSPQTITLDDLQKQFGFFPSSEFERKNLLVIDIEGDIRKFEKYDTVFLLTKQNLASLDDRGGYQVKSLKQLDDISIDQNKVRSISKKADPAISNLPNIIAILTVPMIFLSTLVSVLFTSLIAGLVLMLIGELINFKLSYGKHYQFGMHFVIVSQTIWYIIILSPINLALPYYFIWFPALIGALVYSDLNRTHLQEN